MEERVKKLEKDISELTLALSNLSKAVELVSEGSSVYFGALLHGLYENEILTKEQLVQVNIEVTRALKEIIPEELREIAEVDKLQEDLEQIKSELRNKTPNLN